ncbi:hypothetical protein H6P81_013587 [Aristolochia fimbriata]|uniref:Helitron helicase-like domain-containing protein n=1 Tax=Aristolochia fimbriata TaxID=158543 RepID=A0AAV7EGR3_ARIFI|nr:hypothetical protein H6P81_013587 [Aristolochia fimbriata]
MTPDKCEDVLPEIGIESQQQTSFKLLLQDDARLVCYFLSLDCKPLHPNIPFVDSAPVSLFSPSSSQVLTFDALFRQFCFTPRSRPLEKSGIRKIALGGIVDILYHYNAFCHTGIENNEMVFVNFKNAMEELDTSWNSNYISVYPLKAKKNQCSKYFIIINYNEVFVRAVTQTSNYVNSQGLNVQTSISQTNKPNMPLDNVGEESDSFIGDFQLPTICVGGPTEHAKSSTVQASIPKDFKKLWKLEKRMYVCASCNAIMWIEERVRDSTKRYPHYQLCCKKGKVFLPLLFPPQILQDLYDGKLDRNTYKFKNQVRVYNSMFSFTSMGGKIDNTINDGNGPYTFKISGANYHRIGSLLPHRGQQPKFAQLYIYDTEHEIQNRMCAFRGEEPNSGVDE